MAEEIISIDGETMEGGGQILRMSIAFSTLLKKPIRVYNIRAKRSKPGLGYQHLAGLQLVRDLCDAKLVGGELGSTEITFYPGSIKCGKYFADPGTAGSVMLLFQVSLPCLLFANGNSELELKGGTNADMAPQIDDVLMVFKPVIEKMGVKFNCDIIKRGYFPKGGGHVKIHVSPVNKHIVPINLLEVGEVTGIKGKSFVASLLPMKIVHAMADTATHYFRKQFPGVPVKMERVREHPEEAVGAGSGIIIAFETSTGCLLGGSALGKRGVRAEDVGEKAVKELVEDYTSGSCVDRHVQDQLVIFMALAKGKSRVKIGKPTLHTKTAIYIAELMTEAKFNISEESDGQCILECEGIGLER